MLITFIGKIEGSRVLADVYLNGDKISYQHPVKLTLEQWNQLRDAGSEEEAPIWAVTENEHLEQTGIALPSLEVGS